MAEKRIGKFYPRRATVHAANVHGVFEDEQIIETRFQQQQIRRAWHSVDNSEFAANDTAYEQFKPITSV